MDDKERFDSIYRARGTAPWSFTQPHQAFVDLTKTMRACTALEIGCGEGQYSIYLASHGFSVTGIDVSSYALDTARHNRQKQFGLLAKNPIFIQTDYEKLRTLRLQFDFVFDWRVFQGVTGAKERGEYVETVARLLSPAGTYLSVGISDKCTEWGIGRLRTSQIGRNIVCETLEGMTALLEPHFNITERKIIQVPQKPNTQLAAYFVVGKKK